MIHIATVHYGTDKWIDIQLKYIKKHINEDYRIYAFLSGEAIKHKEKFFYVCTEPIQQNDESSGLWHAIKLNILANIISFLGKDNDILIFLDGDAFPIGNIMKLIYDKIDQHKLLAIQRLENSGATQPHPSFCATTIGLWKNINGDWKFEFFNKKNNKSSRKKRKLLKTLNENNINWYGLNRTSQLGKHPLWFGIYDNLIYHHGSGFRHGVGRIILAKQKKYKLIKYLLTRIPDDLIIRIKHKIDPSNRMKKKIFKQWEKEYINVYNKISYEDDLFN